MSVYLYRTSKPDRWDRVSLRYHDERCRAGSKPCGERLKEPLHLQVPHHAVSTGTHASKLSGVSSFFHTDENHGSSENRSEEQPNKLPEGSKLVASRLCHDVRHPNSRGYFLVTRSTLVVRCTYDLNLAGYSARKKHWVTDNIRVELQVTATSSFEDPTSTHAQYHEPRGTDNRGRPQRGQSKRGMEFLYGGWGTTC